MTQDDILRMARECGHWTGQTVEMNDVGLERFATLVAAPHIRARQAAQTENELLKAKLAAASAQKNRAVLREREACAKKCDEFASLNRALGPDSAWRWEECAAAIRARSNK